MILGQLSPGHPLRNTPLKAIQAECRNLHSKNWCPVATWKIGKNTFNELGAAWTETNEFRVNVPVVAVSQLTIENP